MLYEVAYVNIKKESKKFIVSGPSAEDCEAIAINYINFLGGCLELLNFAEISNVDRLSK